MYDDLKKIKKEILKKKYYQKLIKTDFIVLRHLEEIYSNEVTTLNESVFLDLLAERKAVRIEANRIEEEIENSEDEFFITHII